MAEYKLYNNSLGNPTIVCRKKDMAFIPMSEDNTDYQEYLEWAKTNTIEEAD